MTADFARCQPCLEDTRLCQAKQGVSGLRPRALRRQPTDAGVEVQLNLSAARLAPGGEQEQKRSYVEGLGAETVVAIGQGANDALMLKAAAIGICVLSMEGAAAETLLASDIVVPDIFAAFDLLDKPLRIVASLRK
jgi:soluble P-type ATPase